MLTSSRGVVTCRTRRFAGAGIHSGLEITPALLGGLDLRPRQLPGRLRGRIEENDQPARASIQHAVVVGPHVAAQLSQLAVDLGAVGKRQVRYRVGEIVEAVDLAQERSAALGVQAGDELADGLAAISSPVVDRLERSRRASALQDLL